MLKSFLLLTVLALATARADVHLFILSGQSNMAGLRPEASFTPTVAKAFGKDHVIVVKSAQSGEPIRRWHKDWKPENGPKPGNNGDLYDKLLAAVRKGTGKRKVDSVTLVWMQGERDAKEGHGAVYAESLKGLVAQLSTDLGRADVNFVIGRLSDFGNDHPAYKDWNKVREVQVAVAEASPRVAWVDTDDLNDVPKGEEGALRNDLHYSKEGYVTLGRRFAEAAIGLIKANGARP